MLEPIHVEVNDWFLNKEDMYEEMGKNSDQVDLYLFDFQIARGYVYVEFAQRVNKPVAMLPHGCCEDTLNTAALRARGREVYSFYDWTDFDAYLRALRTRKALKNTRVLVASRFSSTKSFGATDNFVNLEEVTNSLGVKFRNISVHELMDQMQMVDPTTNPSLPGRKANNITPEDMEKAEALADEFIANAKELRIDREYVVKTMKAYVEVQKLMDFYDCNAFSAPCPDLCSTRRINEEQFTFCLTHSLNIENGIPSACDLDFNSLITMAILENLSGKSAYMGNCNVFALEDGYLPMVYPKFDNEAIEHLEDKTNLYSIFHSTPTRKLKGFDEPLAPYSIDSFTYSGFGATVRYDFTQDAGQIITIARIAPDGKKILAARGEIVLGSGTPKSCGQGVIFRVADNKDLYYKQCNFGCHMTLVYGDYVEDIKKFGEVMGLEVVTA